MANLQYIGARYVPKFFTNPDDQSNEWKSGVLYEALTIVTYNNDSYTSKVPVPDVIGNPADNPQYWACTTKYTAALVALQNTVGLLDNEVSGLVSDIDDVKNKTIGFVTPEMFGAVADGVTDDTAAIQQAFDSGLTVILSPKTYFFTRLNIRNDLVVLGNGGTLKAANYTDGGTLEAAIEMQTAELFKVYFENVNFVQVRTNSTNVYYNMLQFNLNAFSNAKLHNLTIKNCHFEAFRNNAIIVQTSLTADVKNILIDGCTFDGTDPAITDIGDAFRIQLPFSDYHGNYGVIVARNIHINNCYAQYVRTLADIKRGCEIFEVSNCFTRNIHDCHHSIDGSFKGQLHDCIMLMDPDFTPLTGTNFIEIQGENIEVYNMFGDSSFKTNDGIFFTHYEYPGVSYYNQSKYVNCHDLTFKNINGQGLRSTGAAYIKYHDCVIENAKSCIGVDHTTYIDIDGNNFKSHDIECINVQDKNTTWGFNFTDNDVSVMQDCTTDNGAPSILNATIHPRNIDGVKLSGNVIGNFDLRNLDSNNVPVGFGTQYITCSAGTYGGVPCVTIDDSNASQRGGLTYRNRTRGAKIIGIEALVAPDGASSKAAFLVQEWEDTTYITSTVAQYVGDITDLTKLIMTYPIQNDNCNNVTVWVLPTQGDPVSVGTLNVLEFKVNV